MKELGESKVSIVNNSQNKDSISKGVEEIQIWLVKKISEKTNIPEKDIDIKQPMDQFNMESMEILLLTAEFEEFVGYKIEPTLAWYYPTIAEFSERLTNLESE